MATFRPDQEKSAYIGQGVEATGEIRSPESVVIDGVFEGEIVCNHLLVGQSGVVKGKVTAANAEIAGLVQAEITVKQLMALRSTGRVEGSWDCGSIEVARGGVLNGAANMAETPRASQRETPRLPKPTYMEEAEEEAPAPAEAPALSAPRRLTKLALRSPRRSLG